MAKKSDEKLEAMLLGKNSSAIEEELEDRLEKEINQAKKEREARKSEKMIKITDISKLSPEEKFDKNTIYKVFNRKQKTETFINGEQAENMIKYTDDYVIRFDHRLVFEE